MFKRYVLVTLTLFVMVALMGAQVDARPLSIFGNKGSKSAPESFADLVDRLSPAVVNISTTQIIEYKSPFGQFNFDIPEGSPFQEFKDFFDYFGNRNGKPLQRETTSLGSGFVIDASGYIVTNSHVIEKAEEIKVIFDDESEYEAQIIGRDSKTDIAILKIETEKPLPYVKFGDSDEARVGDWVIAIGNPFGLGGTVTAGIISARARDINSGPFDDFIQTDASINRGNSGGPMFNMDGEVIGINSAIISPSGGSVGIGFAIPSTLAQPVIKQLREDGKIMRGWLGVKIRAVTEDLAESVGLEGEEGALVEEVTEDSPADKGGIIQGDVILSFNGHKIERMRELPRVVAETEVEKEVPVVVWRQGREERLSIKVGELQDEETVADRQAKEPQKKIGTSVLPYITLSQLDAKTRRTYKIPEEVEGVLITEVEVNSPVSQKGVQVGDIIESVNQKKVDSPEDVQIIVGDLKKMKRDKVLVLVNRGGNTRFVALPVVKGDKE